MKKANLPTENAKKPLESAKQPQVGSPRDQETRTKSLVFQDKAEVFNDSITPKSRYKEILSQPADNLSHKQKLLWLQQRRTLGLWVQCDECDRWRYLDNILDSFELPKKWYCKMNPDSNFASCTVPETPIPTIDEEDLIHSKFSAGSIVWARMPGWPWWPAMVDDCPDTEQFYWLDGFSDIPTYFNVVFFDVDVTRAWITPKQLKHYATNKDMAKNIVNIQKYKKRLEMAITQANDAVALPLRDRLTKYSFIARYKGYISSPKKVDRRFLNKYQKYLKRKFNVDFPIESSSDSDTPHINEKQRIITSRKKTKKSQKVVEPRDLNSETINNAPKVQDNENSKENTLVPCGSTELDSMAVQVSTNASSVTVVSGSTQETILKEIDIQIAEETNSSLKQRSTTPSFDFEF